MSRPVQARTARVTRLTPASSTLHRASGQRIPLGAQVADGEAVTLLTPTGESGTVTLDASGVQLAVTMGRLPAPASVIAIDTPAMPVLAVPSALATPEKAPVVKPIVASSAGPASAEEAEAARAALDATLKR